MSQVKSSDYDVVVEIRGGTLSALWANIANPKILVIDWDNIKAGGSVVQGWTEGTTAECQQFVDEAIEYND